MGRMSRMVPTTLSMVLVWGSIQLLVAQPGPMVRGPGEHRPLAPVVDKSLVKEPVPAAGFHAVVVCPRHFLPILQPWIDHRKQQGYRLAHLDSQFSAAQIRQAVVELSRPGTLRYVILVGDADPEMTESTLVRERCVPTFYAAAAVVTRYGSEPLIPSDNPYGDLDGDQIPELAVGRISVDTIEDLQAVVRKILDYETRPPSGEWPCRVDLVAGIGGFGLLADAVIESAAKKFITDGIPPGYDTHMMYANWRSPYCPDPRIFRDLVLRRLDQGSLFWVYVGHGRPTRLDRFRANDLLFPILETSDIGRIQTRGGTPVALLLACYAGAYDQPAECVGEMMLRHPGGPVAAICGSRVTTPYGMALLASGLLDGYFHQRVPTLGEVLLHAKRTLHDTSLDPSGNRKLLEGLAKTFSPTKDNLAGERTEHLLLMNLLGDPMLRLPYAAAVDVSSPKTVTAGEILLVQGQSSIGGECRVELNCRRDQLLGPKPARKQIEMSEAFLTNMTQEHHQANSKSWTTRTVRIQPGKFRMELPVPGQAHGPCFVRVVVHDTQSCAIGTTPVQVQSPPQATPEHAKVNASR